MLAWLALVALACASPSLSATPGKALSQFVLEHWDTDRGLPQNSVNAIEQTPDGFLWLATFEGLVRFDGSRMQPLTDAQSRQVGTAVARLWTDPDGALWVGSFDRGVSRIRGHDVHNWTTDDGLPSNTVTTLAGDAQGRTWVGTSEGAVRIHGGRIEPVPEVPARAVRDIAFDKSGTAWVALRLGGVLELAPDGVRSYPLGGIDLVSNSLLAHQQGGMLVGTARGLFHLENGVARAIGSELGVASDLINKLARDSSGALWVGFDGDGIQRLHGADSEQLTPADGLPNGFVQTVFEDVDGSIWVGTNAGLVRLRDGVVTHFGVPEGMPGEFARTIAEDTEGNVWIGVDDGGVVRVDRDGQLMALGPGEGLAGTAVRALAPDADGGMWIAVYGHALQHRDAAGRLRTWAAADGLANAMVRVLSVDSDGSVLIGSEGGGLVRLRDGRFTQIEGTAGMDVRAVLGEPSGRLLLGTYSDGALVVEGERVVEQLGDDDGFPWRRIMALYRDRRGHLWVGTQNGLAHHDGNRLLMLDAAGGMFSRAVFFISEDRDGNLWFTGNTGITQVPFEALHQLDALADAGALDSLPNRRVDAVDGLRSQQINGTSQPAGLRASDGRLWFPTARGAAVIDPDRLLTPEPVPRIYVEDVVVAGRTLDLPDNARDTMVLPPGAGRIEFVLSAVQGLMPNSPYVQTRMVGLDPTWSEPSLRREVFYASLAPGEYRFEARAVSSRGTLGPEIASVSLYLQPALMQRVWFWPLVALGIFAIAGSVLAARARRLERHARQLEQRIADRTGELREKNTALESALAQLEALSRTDVLTGVHNRRFLETSIAEHAGRALARYQRDAGRPMRERRGLVILVVDIDFFKEINDRHGHVVGDEMLKAFARMLQRTVRSEDLVVRWGGEEFVVLMREASLADGIALAGRITANARETSIHVDGLRLQRTCSVGLACHPFLPAAPEQSHWSDAIDVADQAMYLAKARGRDQWVALFAPVQASDTGLARRLVRDPRAVLARGEALEESGGLNTPLSDGSAPTPPPPR